MNKITKANFKKLVLALALTLVMTLGMSISVFAAMQTARTINRLATIWSRPPVQSMAAPCMKRRRAGAMWRKGGIRNEVDSDYRCHKVDCCVRCNLHFCLCDKGWKIPLVSSHPCIPDLSGVMAIWEIVLYARRGRTAGKQLNPAPSCAASTWCSMVGRKVNPKRRGR